MTPAQTMTAERRAEIRHRCDELDRLATPGEWRHLGDDEVLVFPADGGMAENVAEVWGDIEAGEEAALGQFIAHSRADVPDLLAALTEAERHNAADVNAHIKDNYINRDNGYPWLTCGTCESPLMEVDAGTTLAELNDVARSHASTHAPREVQPAPLSEETTR